MLSSLSGVVLLSSQIGDVSLSISQTLLNICFFGRHAFLHEAHEGVEGPLTLFLGVAISSAVFDELTLNGLLVISRLGSFASLLLFAERDGRCGSDESEESEYLSHLVFCES